MKIKSLIGLLTVTALLNVSLLGASYSSSGGRSGGASAPSKSSGTGSSWGKSSSPSTPSATPTQTNSSSKSSWGKSGSSSNTKASSDASSALKQKQSMTPPKPRSEYVSDFKAKNAEKYNTKFTTEPTVRPTYIPPVYVSNGHNYNITYNHSYGGYGYMDAVGTFILYDALSHAANNNYQREVSYYNERPVVVDNSGFTFLGFLWWIFKILFILTGIGCLIGLIYVITSR